MAKRMRNAGNSERIDEELLDMFNEIDEPIEEIVEEPKTVRLRLLVDVNLNYKGKVTETWYHFYGAGSEANVYVDDVEIMMQKRVGGVCDGCPSSSGPQPYFEIIE